MSEFPENIHDFNTVEPEYITMPGWSQDISSCRRFEDLPENARNYVLNIEEITGVKVSIVSVGPGREQTIIRS